MVTTVVNEWSNSVASRLDDKAAGERVKAEKVLRDDGVRRNGAADLWQNSLRVRNKSHCDDVKNSQLSNPHHSSPLWSGINSLWDAQIQQTSCKARSTLNAAK